MIGYPRHFIDNAMKTPQSIHQKIEYHSSVCLPYIGPASHFIFEEWSRYKGIPFQRKQIVSSSLARCTHKDNVNESQKPGVYRIPCECGLVYIGETGRNLSVRLKEHKTNCETAKQDKSAVAKHTWTYDHRIKWDEATKLSYMYFLYFSILYS
jgi:predicted GIY-YIG superfamily endonuclease